MLLSFGLMGGYVSLLSLSYLYNCSTDYLLGKQNIEPDVTLNTAGLTDKQIQALISLIESIKSE